MSTGSMKSWLFALGGAACGAVVTAAVCMGVAMGTRAPAQASLPPELKLKAMSGYGSETLGMVTGPIDEDNEGAFLLDYLTGELQAYVMSPQTRLFVGKISRNIVKDLQVEAGKKPAFVMATAVMNFPRGGGVFRPGKSVVYVADANTGNFAVYGVPLIQGAVAAQAPQRLEFVLLDVGKARNVEVRE